MVKAGSKVIRAYLWVLVPENDPFLAQIEDLDTMAIELSNTALATCVVPLGYCFIEIAC